MAKRLKAGERRASILAVAKILFADKGYHGVAVDDIARRLGVSPAVLYQHFPSKEALYEAVVSETASRRESYIEAALNGPDDFGSVLLRMTRVFSEAVAEDPDYLRMEMQAALEDTDTARRFFQYRWKSLTDYVEYSLRELAHTGQVGKVDPRVASTLYQGMVREALYAKCILDDERYRAYTLPGLIEQLIALFLRAIDYKGTSHDTAYGQ